MLLVLGARKAQLALVRRAREMGLEVAAVDPDPGAPGLELADYSYSIDLADVDGCYEIAVEHSVAGIVTIAADYPVPTVAALSARLGLAGPSPDAAAAATDKVIMRTRFAAAGLLNPA